MENLNMDDVDNAPEDDFLTFSEVDEEPEFPEYEISEAGVKDWHTVQMDAGLKTLEVYHHEWGTMWGIRFKEGGQLPAELSGSYTDEGEAVKAAEVYINQKAAEA